MNLNTKKKISSVVTILFILLLLLSFFYAGWNILTQERNKPVLVPIAKHDIGVRQQIQEDDLEYIEIIQHNLLDRILSNPSQVVGQWTGLQGKVVKGSFFYPNQLESPDALTDQAVISLQEGQAVFPLPVTASDTAGQVMLAGHHVDIYITLQQREQPPQVDWLFRCVRVIEIQDHNGNKIEKDSESTIPALVLLALPEKYIPLLSAAKTTAKIELYLTSKSNELEECKLNESSKLLELLQSENQQKKDS